MKAKPPPNEEDFNSLLYGNDARPLFVSLMPTYKQENFKVLLRVGGASYWFLPRFSSKFKEIRSSETTKRPESSLDISESQRFNYSIRLQCCNQRKKKCRAKVNMLVTVSDKLSDEFFSQKCILEKWENYEKHCIDCPLEDPWLELAKSYCDNYNLQNRTNANKLSQPDLRRYLINQLEMSDLRAAQIFNHQSVKTMNNKASNFQRRQKANLAVSTPEKEVPDYLENLSGIVWNSILNLSLKSQVESSPVESFSISSFLTKNRWNKMVY